MTTEASAAMAAIEGAQSLLLSFQLGLGFGSYLCPTDRTIDEITAIGSFDYIIVGAGTAGCILASILSSYSYISVLLLEAGGCPPLESLYPAYFAYLAESVYDRNFPAVNDNYSCQNMQDKAPKITSGQMIGGTSGLNHMVYSRGSKLYYDKWAAITNDSSWTYEQMLPYFVANENLFDKQIMHEYGDFHGTTGNIMLKRQFNSENNIMFNASSELGYEIRSDITNYDTLGTVTPLLLIGNKYRQSSLNYITPIKDRSNLYVLSNAMVTKVTFDQTTATGVQFTYGGNAYEVNSKSEVILSAGVVKSPQLLMLSGIGPASDLESFNISVIVDSPVGENFQDHISAVSVFTLGNSTLFSSSTINPENFPAPITINFFNLDNDVDYAQCQTINLIIPPGNAGLMAICLKVIKYDLETCQKWYEANVGKNVLFSLNTAYGMHSRGYMTLNSVDINDDPIISMRYLSNTADLVKLGKCAASNGRFLNTTTFKNLDAEFKDLGLCSDTTIFSTEFWECYAREMSTPTWQYAGTASMGSVVDSNLLVKGVTGLRVVDASVIPVIPNCELMAPVTAIALKTAHSILSSFFSN